MRLTKKVGSLKVVIAVSASWLISLVYNVYKASYQNSRAAAMLQLLQACFVGTHITIAGHTLQWQGEFNPGIVTV